MLTVVLIFTRFISIFTSAYGSNTHTYRLGKEVGFNEHVDLTVEVDVEVLMFMLICGEMRHVDII